MHDMIVLVSRMQVIVWQSRSDVNALHAVDSEKNAHAILQLTSQYTIFLLWKFCKEKIPKGAQ
jgi:hypothetical protein